MTCSPNRTFIKATGRCEHLHKEQIDNIRIKTKLQKSHYWESLEVKLKKGHIEETTLRLVREGRDAEQAGTTPTCDG